MKEERERGEKGTRLIIQSRTIESNGKMGNIFIVRECFINPLVWVYEGEFSEELTFFFLLIFFFFKCQNFIHLLCNNFNFGKEI